MTVDKGFSRLPVGAPTAVGPAATEPDPAPGHDLLSADERRARSSTRAVWTLRLCILVGGLAFWHLASGRLIDEYYLSTPVAVATQVVEWTLDGTLWFHGQATLTEMALGFSLGSIAGVIVGFVLGRNSTLARAVDPYIQAIYSLPKIALAPLFVLWLGIGLTMKVVLAGILVFFLVFFLVFWNVFAGVRDVDKELVDAVSVLGARKADIVRKVIAPATVSSVITGMKLALPYSMIGAIVGEIVASNRGLGYLVKLASSQFDTAGVFASLVVLMVAAAALNMVLNLADRRLTRWKR